MRWSLVIFDFDGTLADTFPWFVDAVNEAAALFGFDPIRGEDEHALRAKGAREVIAHLRVPAWKMPRIARHLREAAARDAGRMTLFTGVPAMLADLRRAGIALAVVSSNAEPTVRAVLGSCADEIDAYACGASLFGKAAKFRKVIRRLRIPPDAVLCVGDELRDGHAAQSAGLAFGAVAWGYTRPEALRELAPALMFDRVEDVAALLTDGQIGSPVLP